MGGRGRRTSRVKSWDRNRDAKALLVTPPDVNAVGDACQPGPVPFFLRPLRGVLASRKREALMVCEVKLDPANRMMLFGRAIEVSGQPAH